MNPLTTERIEEIRKRHAAVDKDPRYTDKIAHKDRGDLLSAYDALSSQLASRTGSEPAGPAAIADSEGQALSAMREALVKCAERFREYEASHAAKGSIDGDAKARRNCEMAEMCERALSPDAPRPTSEFLVEDILKRDIPWLHGFSRKEGNEKYAGAIGNIAGDLEKAAAALQSLEARNKELEGALPEIIDWLGMETLVYRTEGRKGNADFAVRVVQLFKTHLAALHPATKTGET